MGRINLRSLIDEVLEMVKNKQNEDRKLRSDQELARVNMSWDDTPAGQAYWKDIRGRRTELEKQGLVNAGTLARQQLVNTSAENVANITGRANVASHELIAGATKHTADQNLFGERYKADQALKGVELSSKNNKDGLDAEHIKGLNVILEDVNTPEEDKKIARRTLLFYGRGGKQNGVPDTTEFGQSPAGSAINPAPQPVQLPTPKTAGAPSMTFPTSMGTARRSPMQEKQDAEDAFYRMNPQLKRKKESWFNF